METLVTVMMIVVCFNFLLKQTFQHISYIIVISLLCALFVGSMQGLAIEQSKTQIGEWISNQALMLDMSVLLSIEVLFQITYCMLAAHIATSGQLRPRTIVAYKILRGFPGLVLFPVLLGCLVSAIFHLPGQSFQRIAWGLALVVGVTIPIGSLLLKRLLAEKELRLELLFLSNVLLAILGLVATVNGRTAVVGVTTINWAALAGVTMLCIIVALVGFTCYKIKNNS